MLIFDDETQPIILDSIFAPTLTDHYWVLDLQIMDYTITPLLVLEEIICPTIIVKIQGFEFAVPANWNMLVFAEETQQLDVVSVANLAGRDFTALLNGPQIPKIISGHVTVVDYILEHKNVTPSLNKHQMLCHPVSPGLWVNIAPSDTYNKYLKEKLVGDII